MLSSAREQYREQQKITASAVVDARRKLRAGSKAVAASVIAHQIESAALTFNSTPTQLAEQGIEAPPAGVASLTSVATDAATVSKLVTKTSNLDRLISALVTDAGRTASTVDLGRRPRLTGYIRSLNLPSCSRCAILAGRVYRYSTGFLRHPRCDCLMTPSNEEAGRNLVIDPSAAIRDGQVRGLSQADMTALDEGADLNRVVNIRLKSAGLSIGSSVYARAGQLTPQGCLHLASDRADVVRLLTKHGYIR